MEIRRPSLEDRLAKIVDLELDLHAARDWFLRAAGWDLSSSYPDFVWRWSKEVDGKRLTETGAKAAVQVERHLLGLFE